MIGKTIPDKLETALKQTKGDHIDNVISALFNSNPVTSVFSSFVDNYLPKARQQRLEDFLHDFAEDYENFKNQIHIDIEKLKTETFSYIFVSIINSVLIHYQPEKLRAFRAILLNSLRTESPSNEIKEYYLNLLDSLTPIHIKILKKTISSQGFSFKGPLFNDDSTSELLTQRRFDFQMGNYPNELIGGAWSELISKGLVKEIKRKPTYESLKPVIINGELTEMGKAFMNFIVLEK
jgi:hypothetical protein